MAGSANKSHDQKPIDMSLAADSSPFYCAKKSWMNRHGKSGRPTTWFFLTTLWPKNYWTPLLGLKVPVKKRGRNVNPQGFGLLG
jgi:hypothetical protein